MGGGGVRVPPVKIWVPEGPDSLCVRSKISIPTRGFMALGLATVSAGVR